MFVDISVYTELQSNQLRRADLSMPTFPLFNRTADEQNWEKHLAVNYMPGWCAAADINFGINFSQSCQAVVLMIFINFGINFVGFVSDSHPISPSRCLNLEIWGRSVKNLTAFPGSGTALNQEL